MIQCENYFTGNIVFIICSMLSVVLSVLPLIDLCEISLLQVVYFQIFLLKLYLISNMILQRELKLTMVLLGYYSFTYSIIRLFSYLRFKYWYFFYFYTNFSTGLYFRIARQHYSNAPTMFSYHPAIVIFNGTPFNNLNLLIQKVPQKL